MIDAFRCIPFACSLTASSCAARHREALPAKGMHGTSRPAAMTCRTCEVGEAHARGERPEWWPDGSPVVRIGVPTTHANTEPARIERAFNMKPRGHMRGRIFEYKGERGTVKELAARLGVTESGIYKCGKPVSSVDAVAPTAEPKAKAEPKRAVGKAPPKRTRPAAKDAAVAPSIGDVLIIATAGGEKSFVRHEVIGQGRRGRLIELIEG